MVRGDNCFHPRHNYCKWPNFVAGKAVRYIRICKVIETRLESTNAQIEPTNTPTTWLGAMIFNPAFYAITRRTPAFFLRIPLIIFVTLRGVVSFFILGEALLAVGHGGDENSLNFVSVLRIGDKICGEIIQK